MIKETLADTESRMSKTMEALHRDLNTIRTGRASPALLDRPARRLLRHIDTIEPDGRSLCPGSAPCW